MRKVFCDSDFDIFCLPGKGIGGHSAKETRLAIRRLTSRDNSKGFLGDLMEAASRILARKQRSVEKNKEKRKVIMVQTTKTSNSLSESIILAKVTFILLGSFDVSSLLLADIPFFCSSTPFYFSLSLILFIITD